MAGTTDLLDVFGIDGGVTSVVGAGGKKTTLYTLASHLERAVVTATVRIPIFDRQVGSVTVTAKPMDALESRLESESTDRSLEATNGNWPLGLVPEREGDERYRGYEPTVVDQLTTVAEDLPILVKADGARTRHLKAPNDREPQIPASSDVVLAVASCHAVGHPLTEAVVHRPTHVSAITGRDVGESIRPTDVARVLAHRRGGRKRVPDGARYVPVINMVDDDTDREVAEEIAREVLERAPDAVDRIALTRMIDDRPLVDVFE